MNSATALFLDCQVKSSPEETGKPAQPQQLYKLVKADLSGQVEDIPQLDRTAEGGALWPGEHLSLNSATA